MTAYNLSGQYRCSSEITRASVAEGKRRYKAFLAEIERRRRENYKRFMEKRRKLASGASEMLY